MKRIGTVLTVFLMIAGMFFMPMNAKAAETTDECIKELIELYGNKQEKAADKIQKTLDELKSMDAELGEVWQQIMDYWSYANTEMDVLLNAVPENLPADDSLCIIVLGLKLNDDGTMQEELVGRLETGLAIAEAYPNSYIAVTGGGTAKNNPEATEGQLMGEWLLAQGLDSDRVIIEDRAPDTVGNAENTYKILKENYPQVDSVVLISSDYHVPRGCLLFQSKFILDAFEKGEEPIEIIASVGFETGKKSYESFPLQARGLASVASSSAHVEDVSYTSPWIYAGIAVIFVAAVMIGLMLGKKMKRKKAKLN